MVALRHELFASRLHSPAPLFQIGCLMRVKLIRRLLHFSVLVLFLALPSRRPVQAQFGGPSPVEVATVQQREVVARRDFVANVQPNRRSTIGGAVDGRVDEFLVKAGQRVTAGQPLAKLRTRTISIEIAAAEAELDLREAELAQQKNGSRPEEIDLARAASKSAEATSQYAQAKLKRFEKLFRTASGMSRDEYE